MKDIEQELIGLKEKITLAKEEKARAEGSLKTLTTQLKQEFKCNSLGEAKELLHKLDEEIKTKEQQLIDGLEEIRRKYAW